LEVIAAIYYNNRDAAIHACDLCCHHISHPCLCFIKVIVLAPSSVCSSTAATYLSILVLFHVYVCSALLACTLQSTVLRAGVKTLYNNHVSNKDHYDEFKSYDL